MRRRSCAPSASRSGCGAVESMFAEIGLLVLEGDAAGLAAKVSELSRELRDGGEPEPAPAPAAIAEPEQHGAAQAVTPATAARCA